MRTTFFNRSTQQYQRLYQPPKKRRESSADFKKELEKALLKYQD